jgi:hypothetical protein
MKVKELIEELQKHDGDLPVMAHVDFEKGYAPLNMVYKNEPEEYFEYSEEDFWCSEDEEMFKAMGSLMLIFEGL